MPRARLHRWSAVIFILLLFAPRTPADNIFDIRGRAAQRGFVTADHALPAFPDPSSPMLRALAGVAGELSAADIRALRASIHAPATRLTGAESADLVVVLHLMAGNDRLTVEILRDSDGTLFARRGVVAGEDAAKADRVERLDENEFFALLRRWSTYRGPFDDPPRAANAADDQAPDAAHGFAPLTPPVHGWLRFDKEVLGERLLRGRKTRIDGATRTLAEDEIWARPPRAYTPRAPAGLLVWVNASPHGQPPSALFPIADELNLVCISQADAGNDCPVADRYQRVFDAIATAARRFHIDPDRLYVSGISGGGRAASVLWGCFPDVFRGAAPAVGLSCYENIPIGDGHFWPGLYDKPRPDVFNLLKPQRLAAITGPRDFNYDSIIASAAVLKRDGLNARVFEHADLTHTLPSPDQLAEAIRWIDEPARAARDERAARARVLLDKAKAMPVGAPGDDQDQARRRALAAVTEAAPWSTEAWEAVALIGQR